MPAPSWTDDRSLKMVLYISSERYVQEYKAHLGEDKFLQPGGRLFWQTRYGEEVANDARSCLPEIWPDGIHYPEVPPKVFTTPGAYTARWSKLKSQLIHDDEGSDKSVKLLTRKNSDARPAPDLDIKGVARGHMPPSFTLMYPTSVVIRNCSVDVCSSIEDVSHIMDIDNASHVLIESTKFNAKRGRPSDKERVYRFNTGLRFANIQRVEIMNVIVIREVNYSTLACLLTYLEESPKEGCKVFSRKLEGCDDDAAIQLALVHEATIRDSIFNGFYCGITTKSSILDVIPVYNRAKKICFTGVYNCQISNMGVCVLLDSRFTNRSIFVLSDISLRDSLVGVRVSEPCCCNGCVDVLDTKFINIASSIVVPKLLKKDGPVDAKDKKKNMLSRLETKNLTFPDGGPQNVSRKKRRDDVIKNLMKAGILDSTTSIPYLEKMFNPKGNYLEIANGKDLEPFNLEESRPQSTSDYQSDYDNSVD